jgi:hypothetical protein
MLPLHPETPLQRQELKDANRSCRSGCGTSRKWHPSRLAAAHGSIADSDKPSIGFPSSPPNVSGGPEQQYLSDGITEDIITELSRFHGYLSWRVHVFPVSRSAR